MAAMLVSRTEAADLMSGSSESDDGWHARDAASGGDEDGGVEADDRTRWWITTGALKGILKIDDLLGGRARRQSCVKGIESEC